MEELPVDEDQAPSTVQATFGKIDKPPVVDAEAGSVSLPEGTFALLRNVLADGGGRFGVSALAFDTREELLWMGNTGGHVTSYYGAGLAKYTSFQSVALESPDIRALCTIGAGVISLSRNQLRCHRRQGIPFFTHASPQLMDMQCMMPLSPESPNSLLLGGFQSSLVELDLNTLQETRNVQIQEQDCVALRMNEKYVFSGDTAGNVAVRNPDTLETVNLLPAHSGALSDFAVLGPKVITCGFSRRADGGLQSDGFLMLFDLRTMRALPPVHLTFLPAFVRFLPVYSDNRLVVASQSGEFKVFEIGETGYPLQMETGGAALYAIDVSPTKQCIAFGDSGGIIHLFSDRMQPSFNANAVPTEFADPVTPFVSMSYMDDMSPLSIIPAPIPQDGQLLSDWPPELCRKVYRKPMPIEPAILDSMKMTHFIGYAPNPATRRRNQTPYQLDADRPSEPNGHAAPHNSTNGCANSAQDSHCAPAERSHVPKPYRKVHLKASKLLSEEFNYSHYNKTAHSGLESLVANAYCNPVLIILFYVEPLRSAVLSHLCKKEFCLACELGFLFKMLQQSAGKQPCSSNNFLRAFRTLEEANALGLVLNDKDNDGAPNIDLADKIQRFSRFLLKQLREELDERPEKRIKSISKQSTSSIAEEGCSQVKSSGEQPCWDGENVIDALFAGQADRGPRCAACGEQMNSSHSRQFCFSLVYPDADAGEGKQTSFAELVERSLRDGDEAEAWCAQCNGLRRVERRNSVERLPSVLALNLSLKTERDRQFLRLQQELCPAKVHGSHRHHHHHHHHIDHKTQTPADDEKLAHDTEHRVALENTPASDWIPAELHITPDTSGSGGLKVNSTPRQGSGEWRLKGGVFEVEDGGRHLVACVRCGGADDWLVANDASVARTTPARARHSHPRWKLPVLLLYTRPEADQAPPPLSRIDASVFGVEECVSQQRRLSSWTFVPVDAADIPKRGELVAIDAEFVSLNHDEAEVRDNGTRSTTKAPQMSVARVTCIRGSGPMEGVPFIDDYISTPEEVSDYVTEFSGIKPGDLDRSVTTKHLTTLKSTYLKLRHLVDNGCVFVGHGLANDFRVINILVPTEQIRDTVHLFHLPHHRMVSLRFLAWYFLDMKIQGDTHDSIEDARTALKLHRKYQDISLRGSAHLTNTLSQLYEKGRQLDWRPPDFEPPPFPLF